MRLSTFCLCTLLVISTDFAAFGAEEITVQTVREAWKKRKEHIHSFRYECTLTEKLVTPAFRQPDDELKPPGPGVPTVTRTLRGEMMLTLANGRIAYQHKGEQWSGESASIRRTTFRAAFNGRHNRSLLEGWSRDWGEIANRPEPIDQLTVNVNQTALWLAHTPAEYLSRFSADVSAMTVQIAHADYDGVDCAQLAIPRRNPSWNVLLYVDPARQCLPIGFVGEFEGVVTFEETIRYAPDGVVGWGASSWTSNQFTTAGKSESSTTGRVTRSSYNEPIDDATFELAFPVGTQVLQKDGENRSYFIQEPDGKLRPISEDDYGRLPADVPDPSKPDRAP